jgi:hypothetical protein
LYTKVSTTTAVTVRSSSGWWGWWGLRRWMVDAKRNKAKVTHRGNLGAPRFHEVLEEVGEHGGVVASGFHHLAQGGHLRGAERGSHGRWLFCRGSYELTRELWRAATEGERRKENKEKKEGR